MRKFLPLAAIILIAFTISACSKNKVVNKVVEEYNFEALGVPETGVVLDLTEKNGQTATTTPGDV